MPALDSGGPVEAVAAVERAFTDCRRSVLAKLTAHLGDRQLAEDSVQDAFEAAVRAWPTEGVPDQPEAWMVVAARRKAVDRLRRERTLAEHTRRLAGSLDGEPGGWGRPESAAVADDHLRLVFTCCHPALSLETRVVLTLRTVCGLSTSQIAAALLSSEATTAQRISRARRKIRDADIPYRTPSPDELPERLHAVLATVYLLFNEGYSRRRRELCEEGLRLARLLANLCPGEPEVHGLLALLCLQHSRWDARVGDDRAVPLDEQDRGLWDQGLVEQGVRALRKAHLAGPPGSFQLQAAVAAVHADVAGKGATDWPLVVALYDLLAQVHPSPVVEVNRAVALGMAGRPGEGLRLLAPYLSDPQLEDYQPMYVAHAELLRRLGDPAAVTAYDVAIDHTADPAEATELRRRRDDLERAR